MVGGFGGIGWEGGGRGGEIGELCTSCLRPLHVFISGDWDQGPAVDRCCGPHIDI